MSEQITFATSDFASNPEPRCPCILLLDVSGSMSGRPINELNAGLVTFRDELLADPLALKRVELGIVTFGPVHALQRQRLTNADLGQRLHIRPLNTDGKELAVNEAMAYMSQKVQGGELGLNDILATDIVLTVCQRLFAEAEAKELAVRDFACTFLGLISSPDGTLIMQIGDGGVVVDFGHGLQLPLTPMVGEYANMTHFITDEDAVSRLETFTSTERVHKVAAFTDGIQRLALNMLDNSPHVPFFTPFFNGLASATQEQLDLLPELLKQFLSSPAVNERTDDDKTLALALWLP